MVNYGEWNADHVSVKGDTNQTIKVKGTFNCKYLKLYANVSGATSYQWYKDEELIYTGNPYTVTTEDDYFGEYYCQTDAGNSRKITISKDNTSGTLLEENFDGDSFPLSGWSLSIKNSENTWMKANPSIHPFTDIDPTNVYSALCGWDTLNQDEWLNTPAITLPAGTILLDFYAGYSTDRLSNATLKLNISVDGGANWSKILGSHRMMAKIGNGEKSLLI